MSPEVPRPAAHKGGSSRTGSVTLALGEMR
jgi:hypothetical protein